MIAVIWVVIVAGASTLSWTVISAAGARVSQPVTVATATATPSEPSGAPQKDSVRTSSGRGGRVTAHCNEDGAVSLGTAVPDDGYWVKLYDPGPANLRVDFEVSGDNDNDSDDPGERAEVRVTATCVEGTPVFKRS
jgi:uncharacterized protein (DUF2147 family)